METIETICKDYIVNSELPEMPCRICGKQTYGAGEVCPLCQDLVCTMTHTSKELLEKIFREIPYATCTDVMEAARKGRYMRDPEMER